MKITIVIDDADPAATTEAARTIGRAFVGTGSTESVSSVDADGPEATPRPAIDENAGAAPRVDVGAPSSTESTSGSGSESGAAGNGSQPAGPNPPARPAGDPAGESAGPAPELGGG